MKIVIIITIIINKELIHGDMDTYYSFPTATQSNCVTTQFIEKPIPLVSDVQWKEKEKKKKCLFRLKNICYYNVYIHKFKLSINYSD